ncbi:MAG: ABC transporter ATP-binding protein/permease [Actinobacteria bacterium]|nr:ABC transporter ATP-binding protein/permease [Actinomycetota bacterium]
MKERRRDLPWHDLTRALGFLRPYAAPSLAAFVSVLLMTVATLFAPQFIRLLIDRGITAGSWRWILFSTAGLLGVAVVRGLFTFLHGYLAEKAGQGVAFDLRNAIYEKLQNLSFSYHDRAQTGQLMTRVTSDVENIRTFTGQGFLVFTSSLLTLVGTAAVLLWMQWLLALVALAAIPAIFVVLGLFVSRVLPLFRDIQVRLAALNTVLQENLAGVAVVKAFAREPYELARYEAANRDLLNEGLKVVRALASTLPYVFVIANLGSLGVVWVGGDRVISGHMSLGDLVAFNAYLSFLLMPIFQLAFLSSTLSRAGASSRRVFEILDAEVEVRDRAGAIELGRIEGRVTFEGVGFRYVGQEGAVLQDVSFDVEPGETVALLGTTGSGKSTIINLIPRFYDPTEGVVRVDGVDIRDVTVKSLRAHVGIVLQEAVLFGGTLRENIAYGRPDASAEEVEAAARTAQAHDFISDLPDGYESVVGERGVTLSGGQRQRVSIARTLLVDPRILLLDDATSAVDVETEVRLQLALRELMKGRTSFVIAQRLSTVRLANRVILIDEGRVVGQGTHDELLRTIPLYGEIVDTELVRQGEVGIVPEEAA